MHLGTFLGNNTLLGMYVLVGLPLFGLGAFGAIFYYRRSLKGAGIVGLAVLGVGLLSAGGLLIHNGIVYSIDKQARLLADAQTRYNLQLTSAQANELLNGGGANGTLQTVPAGANNEHDVTIYPGRIKLKVNGTTTSVHLYYTTDPGVLYLGSDDSVVQQLPIFKS